MTIASALSALAQDITDARSAITSKGGTVTLDGGSSQLATDIATIPSGGGDTVDACAYGDTEEYTSDEKVMLNLPSTNEIIPADLTTSSGTIGETNSGNTILTLEYMSVKAIGANRPIYKIGNTGYAFNHTLSASGSTNTTITGNINLISKEKQLIMYNIDLYHNNMLGFLNDEFTTIYNINVRNITGFYPYQYVYFKGFVGAAGDTIYYYTDSNTKTISQISQSNRHLFFYSENGTNYEVCTNSKRYVVNGSSTPVESDNVTLPSVSFTSGGEKIVPLTEDASYVLTKSSNGAVQLWKKSSLTWTNTKTFNDVYTDIFANNEGYICMFNKSTKAQYYGKVNLTTGSVEQLQNIFLDSELPTQVYQYAFNLADKLAMVYGAYDVEKITIKNLNSPLPYQYVAVTPMACSYNENTLTGFVSQNLGRDDLGNIVLKVNTVLDPTDPPWSNIGIVYGMSITVNEGEPV